MASDASTPSNGADVRSLQALTELESVLGKFATQAVQSLADMRAEFRRKQAALDRREEESRQEVIRCEQALQSTEEDGDEAESASSELEDAEHRLANIRFWQTQLKEHSSDFQNQANRFERLIDQTVRRSRHFLQAKIEELRTYHAIQLEPGNGPPSSSALAATSSIPAGHKSFSTATPQCLADFCLPDGFVWVPLAEIDLENELKGIRSEADYAKVPYGTMREGLNRLRAEVLPRLHQDVNGSTSDYFRELDKATGQGYEQGLQRVHDAFFGKHDFVYLVRRRDSERFEITNGRHRIKLAQDMGWDAIPAQVKDLNPNQKRVQTPTTGQTQVRLSPVSAALGLDASGTLREEISGAINAIDQVHSDGALPSIPVKEVALEPGIHGRFRSRQIQGVGSAVDIAVCPGPWPQLTMVHEVGHLLDLEAVGVKGVPATKTRHPIVQQVLEAANRSEAVQGLRSRMTEATSPRTKQYYNYLLSDVEIWARAYAQFIAQNSTNPDLQSQLDKALASEPFRQWSKGDFAPIASAIEAMLEKLRWK